MRDQRFRMEGLTTSRMAFTDPRKHGKISRARSLPTSASRRSQPQCKDVFKLEKLPNGSFLTVPRGGEREAEKRMSMSGVDPLSKSMDLTIDLSTIKQTGPSEFHESYRKPDVEPWMRGNTKRFGNNGPWTSSYRVAQGGHPGQGELPSVYLANARTTTHRDYSRPYETDGGEFDEEFAPQSTMRIVPGSRMVFAPEQKPTEAVAKDEIRSVLTSEKAVDLTNEWLNKATHFEAEIVKKMLRDIHAKMSLSGSERAM
eukprot:m.10316 g.10316  ORF g.10316 m.10316 type:complete len:257 (-) comp4242_c0_seq1:173-943(-)